MISVTASTSVESKIVSQALARFASSTDETTEIEEEQVNSRELTIGPHSRFKLYQLHFDAPGVSLALDSVSSEPYQIPEVLIQFNVQPVLMLKSIRVVHCDQPTQKVCATQVSTLVLISHYPTPTYLTLLV